MPVGRSSRRTPAGVPPQRCRRQGPATRAKVPPPRHPGAPSAAGRHAQRRMRRLCPGVMRRIGSLAARELTSPPNRGVLVRMRTYRAALPTRGVPRRTLRPSAQRFQPGARRQGMANPFATDQTPCPVTRWSTSYLLSQWPHGAFPSAFASCPDSSPMGRSRPYASGPDSYASRLIRWTISYHARLIRNHRQSGLMPGGDAGATERPVRL